MGFWDIFKKNEEFYGKGPESRLHHKVSDLLPNESENEHIKIACISGLLARVAYIDFIVHDNEVDNIKTSLKRWTNLNEKEIEAISHLAVEEIKDLAGLENHKYCYPLAQELKIEERYHLLEALFTLAASDGGVSSKEADEIRVISRGLLLEQKHFVAAQATVKDSLESLFK